VESDRPGGQHGGQAYSVSADGTVIFGLSPRAGGGGVTNYGYKAVFGTIFPGTATQLSIGQLPNFPTPPARPTSPFLTLHRRWQIRGRDELPRDGEGCPVGHPRCERNQLGDH